MYSNGAVPVILDTDMGNDIDDALALAMLHALESRGECRLLGVTVCKDNPYAAAYVDAVNTFYGRGNIPVGVVSGGPTPEPGTFVEPIVNARGAGGDAAFPRTAASPDDYAPAVPLLRRLLARAEDASVTIVMIGFSTNMARLLESGPDSASPLDGRHLVARKVGRVVMMAAEFSPAVLADPSLKREYNVVNDVPSAQRFVAACPAPVVFSGLEVGRAVLYPAASIERDFAWAARHPVAEAYRLYQPMPYDRPTWDLTAVLYACRPGSAYFGLSGPGTATVLPTGSVRFDADPDGMHRYLTLDDAQRARVYEAQIALASQPTRLAPQHPSSSPSRRRRPALEDAPAR